MLNKPREQFIFDEGDDLHRARRKLMLLQYPQIRTLIGYEKKTKYIVTFLVVLQLALAFWAQSLSLMGWFILIYCVGASISHIIFTAIHEVSHNLAFKTKISNRCFAIFINFPLVVPVALGFEKYHMLHHRFMGCEKRDVDIPLYKEAKIFGSPIGKIMWLLLQPFTYTLRPLIKYPQKITGWEWVNIIFQLAFNGLIILVFGLKVLVFLLCSTLIGMSLHPLATHFIAEHYVAYEQQETYSYYGRFNYLTFNVGYHVEHHDFPSIPWSKIKQLKKIAPAYYDNLYTHLSWIGFMSKFIFSKKINLFSRKIRSFGDKR